MSRALLSLSPAQLREPDHRGANRPYAFWQDLASADTMGHATLAAVGTVKSTWSLSAFTVLIYYSLTNLAALQLSDRERLYPRFIPVLGLLACLFLAFWVEFRIWLIGLAVIALGLAWHWLARRLSKR